MMNTVDKVLKIAENEVGYLEKKSNSQLDDKKANAGNGNYTKYNRDMHKLYPSVMDFPAAWCDAFVDWCFQKAYGVSNAKGLLGGNFNDYTPNSANLYKNKGAWYSTPKVGDQIFFKNDVRICHTGLVYKVSDTKVYTIEGNCGNAVKKCSYLLTNPTIAGYGRPKYDVPMKEDEKKTLYRIQIGAFSSKQNAENFLKKVKKNVPDAFITTVNGLHKIQVGAYSKKANAETQLQKMKKLGYTDAFITI